MYARIQNGVVLSYPYSYDQLKAEHAGTSFPTSPTKEALASFGLFEVKNVDPQFDALTQRVEESNPVLVDGLWTQCWSVIQLTAEEVVQRETERAARIQAQRAEAYRTESDPLFFKAQRGEATQQEWLDKVSEIKLRYPA